MQESNIQRKWNYDHLRVNKGNFAFHVHCVYASPSSDHAALWSARLSTASPFIDTAFGFEAKQGYESATRQQSNSTVATYNHIYFQNSLLFQREKNFKQKIAISRSIGYSVVCRLASSWKYVLFLKPLEPIFLHKSELLYHNKYWIFKLTLLNLHPP